MDPYSMNTDQWDAYMSTLLDELTTEKTRQETVQRASFDTTSHPDPKNKKARLISQLVNHPQFISSRKCKNEKSHCPGTDSDFIVDVNGGSVVCIQCGMIQDTTVLQDAHTYADSKGRGEPTSSLYVVHRYSRIAYLRGLLTSTDGETNVELTEKETRLIRHFITNHSDVSGGDKQTEEEDYQTLVRQVKRAVRRTQLRPCLVYHAHTIAYKLFGKHRHAQNETEIRLVLRRFRALENEWDRAPKDGPLRQGAKKFPSIPWIWQRICRDLQLSRDTTHLFYVSRSPKRCLEKRERQYILLTDLALR